LGNGGVGEGGGGEGGGGGGEGSGLGWQSQVSSPHEARQCDADKSFWKQAAGLRQGVDI